MATMQAIFTLEDTAPLTGTILTTVSSAEINIGVKTMNAFVCDQDAHIRVGVTGMSAADNTFFRVPANTIFALDMGRTNGFVRIYNPSASTARYHIAPLSRG